MKKVKSISTQLGNLFADASFKANYHKNGSEIDSAINRLIAEGRLQAYHNKNKISRVEHSQLLNENSLRTDISYSAIN